MDSKKYWKHLLTKTSFVWSRSCKKNYHILLNLNFYLNLNLYLQQYFENLIKVYSKWYLIPTHRKNTKRICTLLDIARINTLNSLKVLRIACNPVCTLLLLGCLVSVEEWFVNFWSLWVWRYTEAIGPHLLEILVSQDSWSQTIYPDSRFRSTCSCICENIITLTHHIKMRCFIKRKIRKAKILLKTLSF